MRPPIYSLSCFRAGLAIARLLPRLATPNLAPLIGRLSFERNTCGQTALRENLQAATGFKRPSLDALCEENVANFSRMLADYFYCAGHGGGRARDLLEQWQGVEHLEEARAKGKGVIVVTAPLGNWELGGILLALRGLPMTVVT